MRAWLVLSMLAGCGRFGFEHPSESRDAHGDGVDDAVPCTFGPWSAPIQLTDLESTWNEFGGDVSADGLTLLFESNRPPSDSDIYQATRTAVGQPWSTPINLATLNTAMPENDPEQSRDGLTLYFGRHTTVADPYLFRATRLARTEPFGTPSQVAELDGEVAIGVVLSSDGTELIYTKYAQYYDLARATLVGNTFVPAGLISELNSAGTDGWATLSSDDLTMYFVSSRSGDEDIYVVTRPARDMPFGTPSVVPELSGPNGAADTMPELSLDGTELYFSSDRQGSVGVFDLYYSTRACE